MFFLSLKNTSINDVWSIVQNMSGMNCGFFRNFLVVNVSNSFFGSSFIASRDIVLRLLSKNGHLKQNPSKCHHHTQQKIFRHVCTSTLAYHTSCDHHNPHHLHYHHQRPQFSPCTVNSF